MQDSSFHKAFQGYRSQHLHNLGVFSHRGHELEDHIGVFGSQLRNQLRQVFPCVPARAQKHRHHRNLPDSLGCQRGGDLAQIWFTQLQVSAGNPRAR